MLSQNDFVLLHDYPGPDIQNAWRACLSRVEYPGAYNSPEFFLEPLWAKNRPFAVLALARGSIVGVLTGIHEGNEVLCGQNSRPQICVDRTADRDAAIDHLARGLLVEAGSAKLVTVYSWSRVPLDAFVPYGFSCQQCEGCVVLDVARNPETIFKQLNKKRRSNIRLAMRNGIEVFQAVKQADAERFYQVYLAWRLTLRKTIRGEQIPWAVFAHRFRLRDNFRFFLAQHSEKVIGGITLRFCHQGLVEYANNSSLDEFLKLRPNDLLVWRAIEWACGQGFDRFSLGGAHRFLREFGGEVEPIGRYRLDRTLLRHHDLRDATLDMARATFRKLPYPVQRTFSRILGKEIK